MSSDAPKFDREEWKQDFRKYSILSDREASIVIRGREGMASDEVADDLGISRPTLDVHLAEINRKGMKHRPTFLLVFCPMHALRNLDEYPTIRAEIHAAYDIPIDVDSAELLRARF